MFIYISVSDRIFYQLNLLHMLTFFLRFPARECQNETKVKQPDVTSATTARDKVRDSFLFFLTFQQPESSKTAISGSESQKINLPVHN